jgi:hypothetical protein
LTAAIAVQGRALHSAPRIGPATNPFSYGAETTRSGQGGTSPPAFRRCGGKLGLLIHDALSQGLGILL